MRKFAVEYRFIIEGVAVVEANSPAGAEELVREMPERELIGPMSETVYVEDFEIGFVTPHAEEG